MSEFVQVQPPKILFNFRSVIEDLRDEIIGEAAPILRREEEASIRARWYRLGRTLRSLHEEMAMEPGRRVYRLFPTAPHAIFGEFGTGRRGAATGQPAPRGWKYGDKPGMEARRYSRIAVEIARPKVIQAAQEIARRFAKNVTVK